MNHLLLGVCINLLQAILQRADARDELQAFQIHHILNGEGESNNGDDDEEDQNGMIGKPPQPGVLFLLNGRALLLWLLVVLDLSNGQTLA